MCRREISESVCEEKQVQSEVQKCDGVSRSSACLFGILCQSEFELAIHLQGGYLFKKCIPQRGSTCQDLFGEALFLKFGSFDPGLLDDINTDI